MIETFFFIGGAIFGAAATSLFLRYKAIKLGDIAEKLADTVKNIETLNKSLQSIDTSIEKIWNGISRASNNIIDLKCEINRVEDKISDLINTIESDFKIKIIAEKR